MRGRRFGLWLAVLWTLAFGSARAADGPAAPPLRLDFISVGQGDAELIRSPAGKTVLIDGGPKEGEAELLATLRARQVGTLDLILLTHRHADHLGGLAAVVRAFGARLYLDAPYPHPSPAYAKLLDTLAARGVAVRQAERGRIIDLGGGATLTLLSPPEPPISGSRSDVNANSVVARLDYRRVGVLFAADAERQTEDWLLGSGATLRAAVLKVPHHGSRYASSPRFLRRVRPEVAIVSAGAGNVYGHPAPETLRRLERLPARTFRTDLDGTISIETDGERLQIRTANGKRETLEAP